VIAEDTDGLAAVSAPASRVTFCAEVFEHSVNKVVSYIVSFRSLCKDNFIDTSTKASDFL